MSDIKTHYLIVGGGMTADAAVRGIREHDVDGRIDMVSQENFPPYDRPPLSKGLWTKKKKVEQIWRGTDKFNVNFHLGREIVSLDTVNKFCVDDQGSVFRYEKLLLATGASPIHLKEETGQVIYYRTFADYEHLRQLVNENRSFTVIGGGYIGSEVAAALKMSGSQVSMVFMENGICSRLLPPEMSAQVNEMYTEKGVNVHPGQAVTQILHKDNQMV
ncbi:NAD(P)/FAD-dependent oxidoreductase, partial [bacterium]|nr:NAD(P)/FAD-dependent oxidoreductase [bacterium]